MRKLVQYVSLTLLIVLGFTLNKAWAQEPLNYYWTGASNTTDNWDDVHNWKTVPVTNANPAPTDFTTPALAVPSIRDNVYFDGDSFEDNSSDPTIQNIVTINVSATCRNMDWTNAGFNPTLGGTFPLTISGSLTLNSTMTITYSGEISFESDDLVDIKTITTNGKEINSSLTFNNDGQWQVVDQLKVLNNLTINNGTLSDNGNQITGTTGTLKIADSGTLQLGDDRDDNNATTLPSFASFSLATNSTVEYKDRTTPQSVRGGISYGNLKLTNATTTNIKNLTAATTITGDLTVSENIEFRDNGFQITGNANAGKQLVLLDNATLILNYFHATLLPLPSFPIYNLSPTSTVVYNGTATQLIRGLNGAGNASYGNLVLRNSTSAMVNKNLHGNIRIRGNLTIEANNNLDVSTNNTTNQIRNISIQGNWDGSAGRFTARTGTVTFNGTSNQNLTAATSNHSFYRIAINNSTTPSLAAGVTLLSPVTVTNNVNFILGDIISFRPTQHYAAIRTRDILILGSAATATVNQATVNINSSIPLADNIGHDSHVVGGVVKTITSNTSNNNFTFPVGNGLYYRPISIIGVSATSDFAAAYVREQHPDINTTNAPLNGAVSKYEYWNVMKLNANASARVILSLEVPASGPEEYFNRTSLTVAAYKNGNHWTNKGNNGYSGNSQKGNLSSSGAIANNEDFLQFTFGSIGNALPVTLISFHAKMVNDQVQLDWKTSAEKNTSHFVVERSRTGADFQAVTSVDAGGNTQMARNYQAVDRNPLAGTSYYRLKIVDKDETFELSKIISVQGEETIAKAIPNPGNGRYIKISAEKESPLTLIGVTDLVGRSVSLSSYQVAGNGLQIEFGQVLPVGIYVATLKSPNQNNLVRVKFIVK